MFLSKHATPAGKRWALDGKLLPETFTLKSVLVLKASEIDAYLKSLPVGEATDAPVIAPTETMQEVWACGVTYLRSRDARKEESSVKDVYQKVYEAERPEIFFKSNGWRVVGSGAEIRIRADSAWNVPEPEMTLVVNAHGEIVGYTAGNDVSSRDIEGENPLYLPQAKVYNGSCALGSAIHLCEAGRLHDLPVRLDIRRAIGEIKGMAIDAAHGNAKTDIVFSGETRTNQMKRKPEELVHYLYKEMSYPQGCFVMTGTGIVPGSDFTLKSGDVVNITVGEVSLSNTVA